VYTGPLRSLIDELGRMPGIGPKSAQRIAFYLLKIPNEDALRLADAIVSVKERTALCERCFNVAERGSWCEICLDESRDGTVLLVVEEPQAIAAFERTKEFKGRYHVLQGALNPLEGIGPEQLKVAELVTRIESEAIAEVVLCTNPNLEGEATAMYLAKRLVALPVRVTRLASGLPVGGDLEYADEMTLGRALEGRRELSG
jgi:recombination protein RecR